MNAALKTKPDMTTVLIAEPPETPPTLDTTTPNVQPVVPFRQLDFNKWGPWLLYRVNHFWKHLNGLNYSGFLAQYCGMAGTLFIRTNKAILLAQTSRGLMEPRPVVDIIFAFKFHPDEPDEDRDIRLLFGYVKEWARSQGARYVRVLRQECLDYSYSKTKATLNSDDCKILQWDLDK